MKINNLSIFLIIFTVSQISLAGSLSCRGGIYTNSVNNYTGFEQLRIVDKTPQEGELIVSSKDGRISFETKRKSDEWIYYTDSNKEEMLAISGYRKATDFRFRNMKINRESFFKFKENTIIGFNIVCRL